MSSFPLCDGVHTRFVMHRDLKPDNVGFRNGVIKLVSDRAIGEMKTCKACGVRGGRKRHTLYSIIIGVLL